MPSRTKKQNSSTSSKNENRRYSPAGIRNANAARISNLASLVVADGDARIMIQLAREIAVAVPLHLPLVDGQNVTRPRIGDGVTLPDFLSQMRARDCDVLVVCVVGLRLLFNDRPISP